MHRQVVRLIALDQKLRLFLRRMNRVAFERDFGGVFFFDRTPDPSCFRVPFQPLNERRGGSSTTVLYSSP